MSAKPLRLTQTFAVLKPDLAVQPVPVTPSLYEDLATRYSGFKSHVLVAAYEFTESWSTWERHPAGDEIVVLISGQAKLVIRGDDGEESVILTEAGSYAIVPRNTWHTARVTEPARMLFITPGEGTENREIP